MTGRKQCLLRPLWVPQTDIDLPLNQVCFAP